MPTMGGFFNLGVGCQQRKALDTPRTQPEFSDAVVHEKKLVLCFVTQLFLPTRTGVLRDDLKERLRNRLARSLLYCFCSTLIFFPVGRRSLSQKQCRVFPFGRSMLSQVRGPSDINTVP